MATTKCSGCVRVCANHVLTNGLCAYCVKTKAKAVLTASVQPPAVTAPVTKPQTTVKLGWTCPGCQETWQTVPSDTKGKCLKCCGGVKGAAPVTTKPQLSASVPASGPAVTAPVANERYDWKCDKCGKAFWQSTPVKHNPAWCTSCKAKPPVPGGATPSARHMEETKVLVGGTKPAGGTVTGPIVTSEPTSQPRNTGMTPSQYKARLNNAAFHIAKAKGYLFDAGVDVDSDTVDALDLADSYLSELRHATVDEVSGIVVTKPPVPAVVVQMTTKPKTVDTYPGQNATVKAPVAKPVTTGTVNGTVKLFPGAVAKRDDGTPRCPATTASGAQCKAESKPATGLCMAHGKKDSVIGAATLVTAAVPDATPVTKPVTPVTKPVTPVTKPVTPVAKPVTPVAKPEELFHWCCEQCRKWDTQSSPVTVNRPRCADCRKANPTPLPVANKDHYNWTCCGCQKHTFQTGPVTVHKPLCGACQTKPVTAKPVSQAAMATVVKTVAATVAGQWTKDMFTGRDQCAERLEMLDRDTLKTLFKAHCPEGKLSLGMPKMRGLIMGQIYDSNLPSNPAAAAEMANKVMAPVAQPQLVTSNKPTVTEDAVTVAEMLSVWAAKNPAAALKLAKELRLVG